MEEEIDDVIILIFLNLALLFVCSVIGTFLGGVIN